MALYLVREIKDKTVANDEPWFEVEEIVKELSANAVRIVVNFQITNNEDVEVTIDGTNWSQIKGDKENNKFSKDILHKFKVPVSEGDDFNVRSKATTINIGRLFIERLSG